ncbi:MAG: ABC transporter ATP-binding protein [Chloroflexaceae bacterium]|nr:ABC transporter ATP-binding protein [Chloroflexaceae bacterium]
MVWGTSFLHPVCWKESGRAIWRKKAVIEARGLTRRFGRHRAIEDISFRVEKGEILGFLGPNGAGKTTTMRILTGYLPATEGSASIAGYDVFHHSLEARRNIGYLPENVPLYPEMTVAGYLDYMARLRRLPERRQAIQRAMQQVRLEDRASQPIAKLSKGYRQRVGLAQALLHDPPVLILDEPTVGLDPRQIIEVRELIRSLGGEGERTIILSTHILPEVSELCQRIIILNEGRIAAIDTLAELTARLQDTNRIHLHLQQPSADSVEQIRALEGVMAVQEKGGGVFEVQSSRDHDIRPSLAALATGQGWGVLELRPVTLSMEEIFLRFTTGGQQPATPADQAANGAGNQEEAQAGDRAGNQEEEPLSGEPEPTPDPGP